MEEIGNYESEIWSWVLKEYERASVFEAMIRRSHKNIGQLNRRHKQNRDEDEWKKIGDKRHSCYSYPHFIPFVDF